MHVAQVVLSAQSVHAEEVPVEFLAEPVAKFRHDHPVAELFDGVVAVVELPRVETVEKLGGGLFGDSELHTEV